MKTRKRWPRGLAAVALLAVGPWGIAGGANELPSSTAAIDASVPSVDATRPNILLVILDDWGTDKSGLYSRFADDEINIPTPTIDRIADGGVLFANAWASPNCSPTRATLITGRYPTRNGVQDVIEAEGAVGIDPADPYLLPRLLKEAGYRTGMIGKWHLTAKGDNADNDAPLAAGFDFWTGTNGSFGPDADNFPYTDTAYYVTPPIQCVFETMPAACAETEGWATSLAYRNETELTEALHNQYQPTYHVDQALAWINDPSSERPWFMYLAFQSPHAPFVLPPKHLLSAELRDAVEAKIREISADAGYRYTEGQRFLSFEAADEASLPGKPPATARLADTSLARAAYAAMVAAVDTELARLLAGIDLHDTYIIVLGDNGTSGDVMDEDRAGFPGADAFLRGKQTLFQGGVSIPLVMSGPDIASPGRTASALVHSSDLYATVLDMAGVPSPAPKVKLDGVSVLGLLRDTTDTQTGRRVAWSEYGPNPVSNSKKPNDGPWGYAIRDDRFKLKSDAVYDESGNVICEVDLPPGGICKTWGWVTQPSLYDLLDDPTEQNDLLANGEAGLSDRQSTSLNTLRVQQESIFESFR